MTPKRYSREWLRAEIEKFQRRIDLRAKLLAGKMKVVTYPRCGYSEKKIRRYRPTVVRRIVALDYEPRRKR